MKHIFSFMLTLLFLSCANAKERNYTGSTPAAPVVRSFLGISLSDSIDFIRWMISFNNDQYRLRCNYGIGKPNTNGFMDGGKWVELSGMLKKESNNYILHNVNKTLGLAILNANLLHILNADRSLLVGNGGWSYTLNRKPAAVSEEVNILSHPGSLPDSMAFQGRTPCLDFARVHDNCYKLKWLIIFYADKKTNAPTDSFINGTAFLHNGKKGSWVIEKRADGKTIYQLQFENDILYLVKLDSNILAFTDKQGRLLVGNEDFSYTLNRKW